MPSSEVQKRREEYQAQRDQLRKDIYADVSDALRTTSQQTDSLESQSDRLVKKIMQHVNIWALMDRVVSIETREEIRRIVEQGNES